VSPSGLEFTRAIVRRPGLDLASGLTTSTGSPPDVELALAQHRAYVDLLVAAGVEVTELEPLVGFPDAYFVEDVAVMLDDSAVVTRPGAAERRGEEEAIAPVLATIMPIVRIDEPATVDGGDVLRLGEHFLIGVSDRTNEEGAAQLAAILAARGLASSAMAVGAGLHLKSSAAALDETTLLLTSEYAKRPELAAWDKVVVEPGEEAAANVIILGGRVVMAAGFAATRRRLEAAGRQVVELDVSEARAMDGGLSCMSLRF
jgi:dimethylargininase